MKNDSSYKKPLLNIKDVFFRFIDQTNYTENLLEIDQILVDYISEKFEGDSALYLHDNKEDPYQLYAISDQQLFNPFKEITFNSVELQENCPSNQVSLINTSPYFIDKFQMVSYLLNGKAYYQPLVHDDKLLGLLLFTVHQPMSQQVEEEFTALMNECSKLLYQVRRHINRTKMGKQYEQLFLVTEQFNSTNDEKEVIKGVSDSLNILYPNSRIRLLFLDEKTRNNPSETEASFTFMTGEIRRLASDSRDSFYFPFRGHQGIYGVIEMIVEKDSLYKNDIEFIQLIANTAGHALENARLY